jgi:carbon monoxide dehydrogenase subunit G
MASIVVKQEFRASADSVWKQLRDFGGVGGWMPGVTSCQVEGEGIGAVRSVKMGDMMIKERLESLDDGKRSFSYSIVEGPMPVQDYLATVEVSEVGPGCRVDWTASFVLPEGLPLDPIAQGLKGAYGGALASLKQQIDGA